MRSAIFLDRDGTINEDVGDLFSLDKLRFIPGAMEGLKLLQERYMLFIITNQPGIGRKAATEGQYLNFQDRYEAELKKSGINIALTLHCPHKKEDACECRKPSPYFIRSLERKYALDLKTSYVIGDHPSDMVMGQNVGAQTVYVLTGHGVDHRKDLRTPPDHIAKDLKAAADWLVSKKNA